MTILHICFRDHFTKNDVSDINKEDDMILEVTGTKLGENKHYIYISTCKKNDATNDVWAILKSTIIERKRL